MSTTLQQDDHAHDDGNMHDDDDSDVAVVELNHDDSVEAVADRLDQQEVVHQSQQRDDHDIAAAAAAAAAQVRGDGNDNNDGNTQGVDATIQELTMQVARNVDGQSEPQTATTTTTTTVTTTTFGMFDDDASDVAVVIAAKKKRRLCRHPGCTKVIKSQGMCQGHGARAKRCKVEGCEKQAQGTHQGMCKRHWRDLHHPGGAAGKNSRNRRRVSTTPPPPEGQSVYDTILPQSIAYKPPSRQSKQLVLINNKDDRYDPPRAPPGTIVMPLVSFLSDGQKEEEAGWHRNRERRARGMFPVEHLSTQLESWERQLAMVEVLLLSGGTPYANFSDLAFAWGREVGFHVALISSVCNRRGDIERKKLSTPGAAATQQVTQDSTTLTQLQTQTQPPQQTYQQQLQPQPQPHMQMQMQAATTTTVTTQTMGVHVPQPPPPAVAAITQTTNVHVQQAQTQQPPSMMPPPEFNTAVCIPVNPHAQELPQPNHRPQLIIPTESPTAAVVFQVAQRMVVAHREEPRPAVLEQVAEPSQNVDPNTSQTQVPI